MNALTKKAVSVLQNFGKWIELNAVVIIWSLITVICATMAVILYIISSEIINVFNVFFE